MIALFAAIILAIAAVGGTVVASDSAGPGDAFYTVDLAVEDARLTFAFTEEAAATLQAEFAEERIEEAIEAAEEGDSVDTAEALASFDEIITTLEGMLEDETLSDEARADLEETIAALEDLRADVETGGEVDVDIDVEDGGSLEIEIEGEDDPSESSDSSESDDDNEVTGVITFYDGTTIVIDGVSYTLGDGIDLGGDTFVGKTVKVEFTTLDDGTLVITEVEFLGTGGSGGGSDLSDASDSSDASEPSEPSEASDSSD